MPNDNFKIELIFSGDSIIRLTAEVIEATLDDQGDYWETKK